jgi:Lrp/AsnC family transcriptional regulator for asnA, asnC and gidA
MIGFVQIGTELGKEREIANKLRKLPEVKEVYGTFGHFDILVKVEGNTPQDIGEIVIEKIRRISGVNMTETIITVEL